MCGSGSRGMCMHEVWRAMRCASLRRLWVWLTLSRSLAKTMGDDDLTGEVCMSTMSPESG